MTLLDMISAFLVLCLIIYPVCESLSSLSAIKIDDLTDWQACSSNMHNMSAHTPILSGLCSFIVPAVSRRLYRVFDGNDIRSLWHDRSSFGNSGKTVQCF